MIGSKVFRLLGAMIALVLALASRAATESPPELEKLQLKYAIECERLSAPVVKLRAQYKARMLQIRDDFAAQGDLANVTLADESVRVDPDPAKLDAMPVPIRTAQKIFLEQLAKKSKVETAELGALRKSYYKLLLALRAQLTGAGQVEQAQDVDAEAERIAREQEIARIAALEPCRVTVSSTHNLSVHALVPGAERLSGGYRPVFESVAEELEGFNYTRVPWQISVTIEITAEEDGYLYAFRHSGLPTIVGEVSKELVEKKLFDGPYLNKARIYRVNLKSGERFECSGHECGVIARKIRLK